MASYKTDYEKNPANSAGKNLASQDAKTYEKWQARAEEAEKDRKQYLPQVKVNRKFAAGKQHLRVNSTDGRVLDRRVDDNGSKLVTADILSQYLLTAVGRLSGTDYRPNFIVAQDNEMADGITNQMNSAFGWGWDNEFMADKHILKTWRYLVVDGTCAIRVRYDKSFGEIVGEVPHLDGVPIFDKEEQDKLFNEGFPNPKVQIKPVREGKVCWELLTFENILPPPGFEDPTEFPWEIIVRPVLIMDLRERYGDKINLDDLQEEKLDSAGSLTAGLGFGDQTDVKLKGRVLVYTGYERPNAKNPNGEVSVWIKGLTQPLETRDHLPYSDHPRGPSTGVHYYRWQALPGRFWGKAFIENGIGPQQVRNKRLTQIDAIIDRNMPRVFIEEQSLARPKTGEPMEIIEVRPGSPLPHVDSGVPPGAWMLQDVKLQEENVEHALGMRAITTGQAPVGISAYSALALLTENDSLKLDPIAQDFRLEMIEQCWDTMECMRNWPPNKQMLIAGPESRLQAVEFNSNIIPPQYLVKIPREGALPRSQAGELQKINDIWAADHASKMPTLDLDWYVASVNAGKPQELPPNPGDQQAHMAELENIAMITSMHPAPVHDYDDDHTHIERHRAYEMQAQPLADQGDPVAMRQVETLETHIHMHEDNAAKKGGQPPPAPQSLPAAPFATMGNPQQGQRPPGPNPAIPQLPTLQPVQPPTSGAS
jgi:hypothetical protein